MGRRAYNRRMVTTARKMTADEFLEYAARGGRHELIRGEVRELAPTGEEHGDLAGELYGHVWSWVKAKKLGKVYAAETGVRVLDADGEETVRAADVTFFRAERIPARTSKFIPVIPDLVAEVVSPTDRANEVIEKVQWWLGHGVRLVWVVDPATRTVAAYRPDGSAQVYRRDETLDAGEVLPGFALPLSSLFES